MQILIAPDKFKHSLSATEVAEALTRGARKVHPEAAFAIRPVADGGEGTVDAFLAAFGGRVTEVSVPGPLGDLVAARVASLASGETVIEMADAAGLAAVVADPRTASAAASDGVGDLLARASRSGAARIVVGVGGSASTDGGTGAARACGWRFLDATGKPIPPGGDGLTRLAHIEPPPTRVDWDVVAACDVDNPLTGPEGAARVFAPQKGASSEVVTRLESGLERLASVIAAELGIDVATVPHGGAGGGMGAGLVAFFGATLRPGLELLADATGLDDEVRRADLVVTGEGRLDRGSLRGKAPIAIARMAKRHGTFCIAITGNLQLERQELRSNGVGSAVGLAQTGGGELARTDPQRAIAAAIEGALRHRLEKKGGRSLRR